MEVRRRLLLVQTSTLVGVQLLTALAVYLYMRPDFLGAVGDYRPIAGIMLIVLGFGLIAALVGAVSITGSVSRPVAALSAAARRVAAGDYAPPPPLRDEFGELSLALARMAQAISEREAALREAAASLKLARDEAVRANHAKSMFLATMSHELRTPLNAVIGFAEIIDSQSLGPIGTPRYRDYAGFIRESGRHLLALIEELLGLATAEAGKLQLEKRRTCPARVLADGLDMVRVMAAKAEVQLKVDGDPAAWPQIDADPVKLRQVFVNLLGNAIKFTPAGGQVTVRGEAADGVLEVSVSDTGIGIGTEDLPLVMQPFYRVGSAYDARYPGAGLGLPLAKTVVELHGGRLGIDSVLGVGTTVWVRLPAEVAPAAAIRDAA